MNERQQALLAYIATIQQHVKGFRSPDDLFKRVTKCMKEDAQFLGNGLAMGLEFALKKYAEKKAAEGTDVVTKLVRDFFQNLGSKARR